MYCLKTSILLYTTILIVTLRKPALSSSLVAAASIVNNSSNVNNTTTTILDDVDTDNNTNDTIRRPNTNQNRTGRDSYLDALKNSHSDLIPMTKPVNIKMTKLTSSQPNGHAQRFVVGTKLPALISRHETQHSNSLAPAAASSYNIQPSISYSPATISESNNSDYGAPANNPPVTSYNYPATSPADTYGISDHKPSYPNTKYPPDMSWYGVPHFHHHYQIPEPAEPEPVDKGHGGFDLKTVLKFILKILIIKKIIKFVYLFMIIFFVPKIKLLESIHEWVTSGGGFGLGGGGGDGGGDKDKPEYDSDENEDKPSEITDILQEEDDDDDIFRRKSRNVPKFKIDNLTEQFNKALLKWQNIN